jgi:hypothetical protein
MEEIDKLEHFTISRRLDGSFWELGWGPWASPIKSEPDRIGRCRVSRACFNRFRTSCTRGPAACPIARFGHPRELWRAKKEAFRRLDAQWNAKRDDLQRRRDWLNYQIGHSTGTAQEKLKAEMEQVKGSIDQFDGQRRNAREVVRQSWEGPRAGQ